MTQILMMMTMTIMISMSVPGHSMGQDSPYLSVTGITVSLSFVALKPGIIILFLLVNCLAFSSSKNLFIHIEYLHVLKLKEKVKAKFPSLIYLVGLTGHLAAEASYIEVL